MTKPLLSLVTGKVERDPSFARLVRSIVLHTKVNWELVVSDASEIPYVSEWRNVRVIHEKPRLGHVRGYNRAFGEAKGKWILFLNDDAEVLPNYDLEAIAFMEAHPDIGLGALHYSENGGPFHVNSAWGCVYANFGIFPRLLGEDVGFFDEDIRMYGGDNSFAFRILLADYGIADIPTARVLHHVQKDEIRCANELTQRNDNDILCKKYMPLQSEWTATYQKYRVDTSGGETWSHGMRPEAVR